MQTFYRAHRFWCGSDLHQPWAGAYPERAGLKVGFFKPIAQPHPGDTGPERSTELVARTHGLKPPQPLGLAHVERMLGDGQLDELLEEIITLYQQAAVGKDVLIVEGMVPTRSASYAARVNLHLAKSLTRK